MKSRRVVLERQEEEDKHAPRMGSLGADKGYAHAAFCSLLVF